MREPFVQDRDDGPASEPLRIMTGQQGTTTCVELAGEWDLATGPLVEDALAAALDAGPECLVFDLTRLDFIDSTGVRGTIQLADRAAAQGVRLVILIETTAVHRLFSICGLTDRLPVVEPQHAAQTGRQHQPPPP